MRIALAIVVAAGCAVLAGCGGGTTALGTTPANTGGSRPVAKPLTRPLVVRLEGRATGTARLRQAAGGQKTTVAISMHGGRARMTAELAEGSCGQPTGLHRSTVLGRLGSGETSWTVPTPYAQLTAAPLAVVVRSATHAVEACGNAPRG